MANRNDPDTGASEHPRLDDGGSDLPEDDTAAQPDDREENEPAEDDGDEVEEELEKAREHADPTRGDKQVAGGDWVSTEEGGNPQE